MQRDDGSRAAETARLWLAIIAACSAGAHSAGGSWSAPDPIAIEEISWTALVDEVPFEQRPRRFRRVDLAEDDNGMSSDGAFRADTRDGMVAFEVASEVPYPRTMVWSGAIPIRACSSPQVYFCLRYRAADIERSQPPDSVLSVTGRTEGDKPMSVALLTVAQVLNDGRWHTVVGRLDAPRFIEGLRVSLTTSSTLGRFDISRLSFHESRPESIWPPAETASERCDEQHFTCLGLDDQYNDDIAGSFHRLLNEFGLVTDGGNAFRRQEDGNRVWAAGIPFTVPRGNRNLIRPTEDPRLNAEQVELLGITTTRHYWEPHGRDDVITVPVGYRASEVYFMLAAELPPTESCYARPPWPRPVDDIENLAVELAYADGQRDFSFPYSLDDEGFRVRRSLGAYVVPADPRRTLNRFILHNRLPGRTFSLGAVTINRSDTRQFPQVEIDGSPIRVPQPPPPGQVPPTIRREGDLLRLSNACYELEIDCSHGFALRSINARGSAVPILLAPCSGIEVESGNTLLTGRAFQTQSIQIDGLSAAIRLTSSNDSLPLTLLVELRIDTTPQVTMNLTANALGEKPLDVSIRFPVLRDVRIGELRDTWMFFPQYRTVISKGHGTYYVPNDCRFPAQVFDIYNPQPLAGVGLGVITHNRDQVSLDYSMGKNARGVTAYVRYPGELYSLVPGQPVAYVESCLVVHPGDWHEAVRVYRDGLTRDRTLSRSGATQRDWFRRVFVLRNHHTRKNYDWVVPIYDAARGTYRIDDFVRADTDYLGLKPDVFHLFGWIDLDRGWLGHPNGDYRPEAYTGGPAALKRAVCQLQQDHDILASLYTISDRCYKHSDFGRQHGEQLAIRHRDGSLAQDEFNWYLCGNSQAWRDQYVESLCRTQRETGVRILYVDVFPFSRSAPCYSREHGHEVPSHVNRGTYELIRQLRRHLPDDVAIWSEYPLPDYAQSYVDGNIHYYCLDWYEHFGRTYDHVDAAPPCAATAQNIYRYLFPHLKQFVFPCGMSPWSGDVKFPFFNGEGLYDCSWCLYGGPNLDHVKRSLAIQRTYADCFSSLEPCPEVETLQREVHANLFPGKKRRVWTLFNARYTTVRGPVLAVPHRSGATYRDVWNDVTLEPEIIDGSAVLSLTLYPQQAGCLVQQWTSP